MATLIPFTGGVESTYLAQKAVDRGEEVILGYYGVSQSVVSRLPEIVARRHMIDYLNRKSNKNILECYGFFEHMCMVPIHNTLERNCIRQAWNLINNLIATVSVYNRDSIIIDSVWMGWAKYDTAEHSLCGIDFTEAEYQRLLDMFAEGLFLSNFDKSGKRPFLPLQQEESKKAVYDKIVPELQRWVSANGRGEYNAETETVYLDVYSVKKDEYTEAGITPVTSFPMVKLNPLEQAMIDFQRPNHFKIPLKYHGYREWLKRFDSRYHEFLSIGITRIITGNTDKVYFLNNLSELRADIVHYLNGFHAIVSPQYTTADAVSV